MTNNRPLRQTQQSFVGQFARAPHLLGIHTAIIPAIDLAFALGYGGQRRHVEKGVYSSADSRSRAGAAERAGAWGTSRPLEVAEVCAFLGIGVAEFHAEPLPGARLGAGLCDGA